MNSDLLVEMPGINYSKIDLQRKRIHMKKLRKNAKRQQAHSSTRALPLYSSTMGEGFDDSMTSYSPLYMRSRNQTPATSNRTDRSC